MVKKPSPLPLLGLFLVFGFPSLPISRWENEFKDVTHLVVYEAIWWAVVLLVLLLVKSGEKRPLSSLGFCAPGWKGVLVALGAGVVTLTGLYLIYFVIFPLLHVNEGQQINLLTSTPFWWRVISTVRAAIGEEVLFRGYGITRTAELTGSLRFAAFLSWAIFTLDHVGPWGWAHLLVAGFGGLIFTFVYLWRRNLWITIIAHFIVDGAAVVLVSI